MGSNGRIQRQKIQPIIDVPLVLQLENIHGEECTSQYNGLEYRYYVTCDDSPSLIYLNESGRDAILQLRPQPGDYIELVKQKYQGEFVFSAQLISDADERPEPPPPPPPPQRFQQQLQRQLAAPAQARHNGASARVGHQHSGNGRQGAYRTPNGGYSPRSSEDRQPISQAQPPRPEATNVNAAAQQMAGCLRIAFDAWEELKSYASEKGVVLEYTSEDVRALGITWLIKARENGR